MGDLYKLVIEALSGPSESPDKLYQRLRELDMYLKASDKQALEAVTELITNLVETGIIPKSDSEKLFEYINQIELNQNPSPPRLQYLHGPVAHFKAKNTAAIFNFINVVNLKLQCDFV